jgi:hypothetical protein
VGLVCSGTIIDKDADSEQAKCQTLAFMAEWLPSLYASSFRAFMEIDKRIPVLIRLPFHPRPLRPPSKTVAPTLTFHRGSSRTT